MGWAVFDILFAGLAFILAGFMAYSLVLAELYRRRRRVALTLDEIYLYVALYTGGATFLGLTCYGVQIAQQAGDFFAPPSIALWVNRIMIGCFVSATITLAILFTVLIMKRYTPTSR
jgi:hypothetical protein